MVSLRAFAAPVEIAPSSFTGALQPQVAVGAKGEIHVVFGQKDGAIFHTLSTDEARTFRAPVKIGALPKLALGMHRGPRIAIAGERVVVTAVSHEGGDLLAWASTDRGVSWTGPATLNTAPKSAREGLHAMAASGERVAVAWLDLRNSGTELWGALSKNGGASWEPDARIYQSPDGSICQCCAPSLAFGPRGELAAMWRNALGGARDLYAALSSDGGQTFAPAVKLGTGTWKLNACPMDGGGVTFLRAEPEEALLNCATCHQTKDRHRGLFGNDCAQCHATTKWTLAEYRHPSSASQSCAQCHQAPPSHYMMHFQMIDQKICGQPNAKVNQCFLCHQTTSWNDIKGVGFYKHH